MFEQHSTGDFSQSSCMGIPFQFVYIACSWLLWVLNTQAESTQKREMRVNEEQGSGLRNKNGGNSGRRLLKYLV